MTAWIRSSGSGFPPGDAARRDVLHLCTTAGCECCDWARLVTGYGRSILCRGRAVPPRLRPGQNGAVRAGSASSRRLGICCICPVIDSAGCRSRRAPVTFARTIGLFNPSLAHRQRRSRRDHWTSSTKHRAPAIRSDSSTRLAGGFYSWRRPVPDIFADHADRRRL